MGPPGEPNACGWERRTRTSTTGSRAPRPTIRRSPNVVAILRSAAHHCQGAGGACGRDATPCRATESAIRRLLHDIARSSASRREPMQDVEGPSRVETLAQPARAARSSADIEAL